MFKKQRFKNFLYSDFWNFVRSTIEVKIWWNIDTNPKVPKEYHGEEAVDFLNSFISQTQNIFTKYAKYAPSVWTPKKFNTNWLEHFSDESINRAEIAMRFSRLNDLEFQLSLAERIKNKKDIYKKELDSAKYSFLRDLCNFETFKYMAKHDVSDYIVSEVMEIADDITREYFKAINYDRNIYFIGDCGFDARGAICSPTSDYIFRNKFLCSQRNSFDMETFSQYLAQQRHLKFYHYYGLIEKDLEKEIDELFEEAVVNIKSSTHSQEYKEMIEKHYKKS